jgi:LacI family transcriptional regulator
MTTKRRVSSIDVAKLAGVSQTTVSFVLSGQSVRAVPAETRERVVNAARQLRYRTNRLTNGVARGKTDMIGVVMPQFTGHYAEVLEGINEILDLRNCRLLLTKSQSNPCLESDQINTLLEYRVDALICVSEGFSGESMVRWADDVLHAQIPLVVVDETVVCDRVDCVITEDVQSAQEAVSHLIALGHRRIAHIYAGSARSTSRDRLTGYKNALRDAGLPFDPSLVRGNSYLAEDGECAAINLLSGEPGSRPTAIFAANDTLAMAAYRVARSQGIRIPDDLSLVGYGDLDIGRGAGLATVVQDHGQVGRTAATRLFERFDIPGLPVKLITLPTHFEQRDTTRQIA